MFRLLILAFCVALSSAVSFKLSPNTKRCFHDEIHKDILVTGEYEFSYVYGSTATVHITDQNGQTLYKREDFSDNKGQFSFTTDKYDIFQFCIFNNVPAGIQSVAREVSLKIRSGVDAKNFDELAKALDLKPQEALVRKLEETAHELVASFSYLKAREQAMRSTNESTNSRVLYLSIFSMICVLGLAAWQLLFFRKYFKTKKLID